MGWFSPYKNVINASSGSLELLPLAATAKRIIPLNNLDMDISAGEQIYVNLESLNINTYYNSSLQKVSDDFSYIVVLEDNTDEDFFVPVKSRIIDNVLYFLAEEDIEKDIISNKYYAIYYGSTYLKTLEPGVDVNNNEIFVTSEYGSDTSTIPQGSYFDIAANQINFYTKTVTSSTEGKYSLAYYNAGTDWDGSTSQKVGAKLFGTFSGPRFRIKGSKGKQYGNFKISIFPYTQEETFSKFPVVDSFVVDCYSPDSLDDQILYSKTDLDYNQYIFEVEVLSEKNIMAIGNSVKIDSYEFTPDYGLTYEKEQLNKSLSFVRIFGVG